MTSTTDCPHKNVCKGTASPRMYEHVKKISLELGMIQVIEKTLKSGKIKFRFEMWSPIAVGDSSQ